MKNVQAYRQKELLAIKAVVDAYFNESITVTNDGTSNLVEHIYDIGDIMGIISNHAYAGLGLAIPKRH